MGNSYETLVQNNIGYIKGLIVGGKRNSDIIDGVEKILSVLQDNTKAQLYSLWKINLFISDTIQDLIEEALLIHESRKLLFLDVLDQQHSPEVVQRFNRSQNLLLVLKWIVDVYSQLKSRIDELKESKPFAKFDSEVDHGFKLEENIKNISRELESISESVNEIKESQSNTENSISSLKSLFFNFTNDQSDKIENIINQLDSIEEGELESQWNNELFQSQLTEILNQLDSLSISNEDKESIKSKIESSSISIKHKLKFVIPLSLTTRYEAELEVNAKNSIPNSLKEWQELFLSKQK